MKYQRIFAALTAASLLLCGCGNSIENTSSVPTMTTQTQTAGQPHESETTPVQDVLTNLARTENYTMPEGIYSVRDFRQTADSMSCLGFGQRETYYMEFTDNLALLSQTQLVNPAAYDGYYFSSAVYGLCGDAVYSVVSMENHSNMKPYQEGDENYDWDAYHAQYERDYLLCVNSLDGTLQRAVPLTGLEEYEQHDALLSMGLHHCAQGIYLLLQNGTVLRISEDGTVTEMSEGREDVFLCTFLYDNEGKPLLRINRNENGKEIVEFSRFDEETGTSGEVFYRVDEKINNGVYAVSGRDGYALFLSLTDGIYGVLPDGTAEFLVDWTASDCAQYDLLAALPDNAFLGHEYMTGTSAIIRRRYASEIPEKTLTLTMGVLGSNETITAFKREFNKSQDVIELELVDYKNSDGTEFGIPDAKNDALDNLKFAIISGDAPDIIVLTEQHEAFMQLGKRGAFLNFYDLMQEDGGISKTTVLPNILTAAENDSGALYSLPIAFSVKSLAVKSRLCSKENWTVDDMLALYEDAGEAQYKWHSKEEMLELLLEGSGFVDAAHGTCSFDSPEFIKILEFCNRYPDDVPVPPKDYSDPDAMAKLEKYYREEFERYRNDEDYLCNAELSHTKNMMACSYSYTRYHSLEEEFTYVGYPTTDGKGGRLQFHEEVGISHSCANPQEAWQVVEQLLQYYENTYRGYPITEAEFEKVLDSHMVMEEFGKKIEFYEDDGRKVYPLNAQEREQVEAYIRSCDSAAGCSSTVLMIVMEEAESFFAGDYTAEDAAKRIQNRVGIYLSEQM